MQMQNEILPKEIKSSIDFRLTHGEKLSIDFFECYLQKYPESDYLIGMKLYYMLIINFSNYQILNYINKYEDLPNFNQGSFYLMSKGVYFANNNDFIEAKSYFMKSLDAKQGTDNKWLYFELFKLLYYKEPTNENIGLGIEFLKNALFIDKNFYSAVKEMAIILIDKNDYSAALDYLVDLEFDQNEEDIIYLSGLCYQNIGKISLAIKKYRTCLDLNNKNLDALLGLAYCYERNGKNKLAEFYYRRAYELNSKDELTNKAIGAFYFLNNNEKAIQYYENALHINSSFVNYSDLVQLLIYFNRLSYAEELNKQCEEIYGDNNESEFYNILIKHKRDKSDNINDDINLFKKKYKSDLFDEWLNFQIIFWKLDSTVGGSVSE